MKTHATDKAITKSRCGIEHPEFGTPHTADVTCLRCRKAIEADYTAKAARIAKLLQGVR